MDSPSQPAPRPTNPPPPTPSTPSHSAISPTHPSIPPFLSLASARLNTPLLPSEIKDVFSFAHPPSLRNAMLGLKTATTSWPIPSPLYWGPGDLSVVLDNKGKPAALIRTLSFVKCRFKDVDEEFAVAEAEGGFGGYREGHLRYYKSLEKEGGERFGEESWVLCERFEVLFPRRGDEEGRRWFEGEEEEQMGREGEGEDFNEGGPGGDGKSGKEGEKKGN